MTYTVAMNPQNPQNSKELELMLHKGMGRAIQFLMGQDISQYRDIILNACIHDQAYDQQCEDTRAQYLYPLIKMSGEESFYRKEILRALPDAVEYFDAEQMLDFALFFAKDGDENARKAIYEKIELNNTNESLAGSDQAIELDGIPGLVFILDLIGSDPDLLPWHKYDLLIKTTEKTASIDDILTALRKAYTQNPCVAKALDNMSEDYSPFWTKEELLRQREKDKRRPVFPQISETMTWEDVKNHSQFEHITRCGRWSAIASEEEFAKAALDLSPDDDPKRLRSHLFVFRKRPYPFDPITLISLVGHENERVAYEAIAALEMIKHPSIREFSHQIVKDPKFSDCAIGLLKNNYQCGDDKFIKSLLNREFDIDSLHSMCMDTIEIYRANPIPEGLEPLFLVYEKTPCSNCRHRCIEAIQTIAPIPNWMIEECILDADSEIRELAARLQQEKV